MEEGVVGGEGEGEEEEKVVDKFKAHHFYYH